MSTLKDRAAGPAVPPPAGQRFTLPAALPAGERLLWQGAPDWRALARNALHLRGLSVYLGLVVAWVAGASLWRHDPLATTAFHTARAAVVACAPIALGLVYAWLAARAAAYTITNRRVVIRLGIGLPLTLNLPFSRIDGADLVMRADGTGDLVLTLAPGSRGLGYIIMWPHTRPWQFGQSQPMLRGLTDARAAGAILSAAIGESAPKPVSLAQSGRMIDTSECQADDTLRTA